MSVFSVQAMCGLLQCGPAFDPKGLTSGGYLYNWLQTVLNSPKEKVGFLLLLITWWAYVLRISDWFKKLGFLRTVLTKTIGNIKF